MSISLGLVGLGGFGAEFASLFKSHPMVSRIALCDREPERIKKYADDPFFKDKFNPRDAYASLDDICKSDIDALVIITQPWLHAPQCVQAMNAGKHVYSAVPIISVPDGDEILDWCDKIIDTCKRTGRSYMLGETTYYRPESVFCRRKAAEGAFGHFVYAEGDYCHDYDDGMRQVSASRMAGAAGKEWHITKQKKYADRGIMDGPMHYPTHSVSGPVSVMNAYALKVTCHGYQHRDNDPYFNNYAFSNETALFKMSNGATVCCIETREAPGVLGQVSETFRIMGTRGTFSENRWFEVKRYDPSKIDPHNLPPPQSPAVYQKITPKEMFDPLPLDVQNAFKRAKNRSLNEDQLRNIEFKPTGHGGSHPYLVHEFVDAVASGRMPAINAWEAARYMAMGVMAHKSALKDGETLNVPDWGDAPIRRA